MLNDYSFLQIRQTHQLRKAVFELQQDDRRPRDTLKTSLHGKPEKCERSTSVDLNFKAA